MSLKQSLLCLTKKYCISFVNNNKQQILLWIIALMVILDSISFTLKPFYILFGDRKTV